MLDLPGKITVCEVGPRDGLQSLPKPIDTDTKVKMIDRLSETGLPVIEVTGFAHPRVIPNLADAEAVCDRIKRKKGIVYRALVPNSRGAERAVPSKVDEMLGLTTVSETYLKKNQNMTRDQAVAEGIKSFRIAEKAGIKFVMALGISMWCPYEGVIPEAKTLSLVDELRNAGIRRFYLAGSLGMEQPRQVSSLFRSVLARHKDVEVGYHVHNLAGYGTANILAAMDAGVTFVEGSICGIGGGIMMPTTMVSVGNLPTEDIVTFMNEMGVETGVKTESIVAAARDIAKLLDITPTSHVVHAGTRHEIMERGRTNPREHPA